MKLLRLTLLAFVFVISVTLQDAKNADCIIRCETLFTGEKILDNGVVVIKGGKIAACGTEKETAGYSSAKTLKAKFAMPGMFTMKEINGVTEKWSSPDIVAADYIDQKTMTQLLRFGITNVIVSPGNDRIISGRISVVKTAGKNRIVKRNCGLKINITDAVEEPPKYFEAPVPPNSNERYPEPKRQYPANRMETFAYIRDFFKSYHPEASHIHVASEKDGRVWIETNKRDDIARVVKMFDGSPLRAIFSVTEEAGAVVNDTKTPIVLRSRISPTTMFVSSAAAGETLARAGVNFFPICYDFDDPLFAVSRALAILPEETRGLELVTSFPAAFSGVEESVGRIVPGLSADVVLLSGKPYAPDTTVEKVLIDGEIVYEGKEKDAPVKRTLDQYPGLQVYRVGTLVVNSGSQYNDGMLAVSSGKIVYAGPERRVPDGTKVTDYRSFVCVPGLVDSMNTTWNVLETSDSVRFGRGLKNDATIYAPTSVASPPSSFAKWESKDAAKSGVTASLLCPLSSGPCSLVKANGKVVREVAAVRFHVRDGNNGLTELKGRFDQIKKYYEEKLKAKLLKVEAPAKSAPKAENDPISGTWEGTITSDVAGTRPFSVSLSLKDGAVYGSISAMGQSRQFQGTWDGKILKFSYKERGVGADINVELDLVSPGKLKGTATVNYMGQKFVAAVDIERTSTNVTAPAAEGGFKEDKAMEALVPLVERRAIAIFTLENAAAVEVLKRALQDFDIDYAIVASSGIGMALEYASTASPRGLIFTGGSLDRFDSLAGYVGRISIGTNSNSQPASSFCAVAARLGLSPEAAVAAVTDWPATIFGIHTIGNLAPGSDADFVMFTSKPSAAGARAMVTVIDGVEIK